MAIAIAAWRTRGSHLIAITLVVAFAFCGLVVQARLQARQDDWNHAQAASSNLNRAVAQEIGNTIESLGLSLQAVVDNLQVPGVSELPLKLRHLVLFDRALTAKHVGVVLLIDEWGAITVDSNAETPRHNNVAEREYFKYHRDHTGGGLHVSAPYRGSSTQQWVVAVSRRLEHPDGSFAGLVMATIRLDSIRNLFSGMEVGPRGAITLYRNDGIILMRSPYQESNIGADLSSSPAFQRAQMGPSGQYVGNATLDNTQRLFTYSVIPGTELRTSVSIAVADIEAGWWRETLYIGSITFGLVGVLLAALLQLRRELRRRQAAEAAARESEMSFRLLAENCSDMVSRLGPDGTRRYVSPASQRIFGRAPETLVGYRPQEQIHPNDVDEVTTLGARVRSGAAEHATLVYRARHSNGAWIWIESTIRNVRDPATGKLDGSVALSRDVTERKELEERLVRLASLDGLTGLANRRSFDDALEREWVRCARLGQQISILLIDVDRFKALNDHYGHQRGDECLRLIGATLGGVLRRASDFAARYGGEEFVVLLPNTNAVGALTMAQRVRAAIEALAFPHAGYGCATAVVTVSVGVATLRSMVGVVVPCPATLVELADQSLYEAKRTGRNRVVHRTAVDTLAPGAGATVMTRSGFAGGSDP